MNQAQKPRDYQENCLVSVDTDWATGETPLEWLATGGGKTTIFSELLVRKIIPATQRALVIAHTREIIFQIQERIRNQFGDRLQPFYGPRFAPGLGLVMGSDDSPDARIVVATRQSLHKKRLAQVLRSGAFDVVIIDEAHHVAAGNSYHDIIEALRKANPNVKIVGFTATPKREDRKAIGAVYTKIGFKWTILDGIKGGYLSPATRIRVRTGVDASGVKTKQGDYDQKQLISVLDANNWVTLAIDAYKEFAGERQTLAFFPKVDMSREFVARLNEAGILAAHVDANTPKEERASILQRYQRGELRVVGNMGVLTEGFDAPQTSAILLGRPTRSETLFTQIVGRGLRLFPGKQDCLIIDMTVQDTKLLEVGTVLGQMADCTNPDCGAQFWKGLKTCPTCGQAVDVTTVNTKACPRCLEEIPRNAKVCPFCQYMILSVEMPQDFQGTGVGLHTEIAQLFHDLSSAWQSDDVGWFSCGVGFDGSALVIAPPNYAANEDRLRERIGKGYGLLPALNAQAGNNIFSEEYRQSEEISAQIAMLERELHRSQDYTLYYVPATEKNKITNRDLPEDQQKPVEYIRANNDLAALMKDADYDAQDRGGSAAASKTARWRNDLASEGQRDYLRTLGAKNLPKDLTKGDAAKLITHYLSVRRVRTHIADDVLPDPLEYPSYERFEEAA